MQKYTRKVTKVYLKYSNYTISRAIVLRPSTDRRCCTSSSWSVSSLAEEKFTCRDRKFYDKTHFFCYISPPVSPLVPPPVQYHWRLVHLRHIHCIALAAYFTTLCYLTFRFVCLSTVALCVYWGVSHCRPYNFRYRHTHWAYRMCLIAMRLAHISALVWT